MTNFKKFSYAIKIDQMGASSNVNVTELPACLGLLTQCFETLPCIFVHYSAPSFEVGCTRNIISVAFHKAKILTDEYLISQTAIHTITDWTLSPLIALFLYVSVIPITFIRVPLIFTETQF